MILEVVLWPVMRRNCCAINTSVISSCPRFLNFFFEGVENNPCQSLKFVIAYIMIFFYTIVHGMLFCSSIFFFLFLYPSTYDFYLWRMERKSLSKPVCTALCLFVITHFHVHHFFQLCRSTLHSLHFTCVAERRQLSKVVQNLLVVDNVE